MDFPSKHEACRDWRPGTRAEPVEPEASLVPARFHGLEPTRIDCRKESYLSLSFIPQWPRHRAGEVGKRT
jgi:hypothetical protein